MLSKLLILGLTAALVSAQHEHGDGDDPLQWLRDSIPGEPGVDYPIFSAPEETNFDCSDKVFGGYYADPQMGCQAYHVCLLDPLGGSMYPTSFLCPNGTLFQQQIFNCDWWYNVDCAAAESLYGLAEGAFGSDGGNGGGDGGGGQCPNANPLSDAECGGAVSNCWSPGQSDTDCPNFGLCCFDGCANTCVDGPQTASDSRPVAQTTPRPQAAPIQVQTSPRPVTTTGYNYPVPEVTLPIRPQTTPAPFVTTAAPFVNTPASLYGAPPRSGRRQGRRRNRGGRRRRRGRRVLKRRL